MIDWSEVGTYATYFLGGACGGFIRQLVIGKGNIVLWRKWSDEESGKHGIDLGILSSLIIGGVVGMVTDQSFMSAFAWGTTGSYLIEEIMKREMNK